MALKKEPLIEGGKDEKDQVNVTQENVKDNASELSMKKKLDNIIDKSSEVNQENKEEDSGSKIFKDSDKKSVVRDSMSKSSLVTDSLIPNPNVALDPAKFKYDKKIQKQ